MSADHRLLDQLPPRYQEELVALGKAARTLLGKPRKFQDVVDRRLDVFERLLSGGLSYAEIALLLHEVGVARPDGWPLPESTLSSAVSRSRPHRAAASCGNLQGSAGPRREMPEHALTRGSMPNPAETRGDLHAAAAPRNALQDPAAVGDVERGLASGLGAANQARDGPTPLSAAEDQPQRSDADRNLHAQRADHSASLLNLLGDHYNAR
jgi:hypothetical protein